MKNRRLDLIISVILFIIGILFFLFGSARMLCANECYYSINMFILLAVPAEIFIFLGIKEFSKFINKKISKIFIIVIMIIFFFVFFILMIASDYWYTPDYFTVSSAKEFYCKKLLPDCRISTDSVITKNFDANRDGYEENKDTLFELCKNYFGINAEPECKRFCGCPS